mgnify:CR=1 FL=1
MVGGGQFTHPGRGATEAPPSIRPLFSGSIHAPREGCDQSLPELTIGEDKVQFTHPGRGATIDLLDNVCLELMVQFTHPGRGATIESRVTELEQGQVQFTHPGRGATTDPLGGGSTRRGSIHAPREGCDGRRCR